MQTTIKVLMVGGAVRDKLLGIPCKDVDYLVTGATPEQMVALGYEQVGADFPVFLHPKTKDEYALARIERKTGVGYHGFAVEFDPSVTVEDDLSRRDLTINAMAMDPDTGEIIDPFGGQRDLEARVLRHVSPAFAEDPLRVVRLARFAARYFGFTVTHSTMRLSREMVEAGDLNHLPNERFWVEMEKALGEIMSGHFFYVLDMVGAFEGVTFFRDLLEFDLEELTKACFAVKGERSSADRLMFFAALAAKPDAPTILTAPSRTQKLHTNINRFRNTKVKDADTVYTVLFASRVWSQSPDFDDLVAAVEMEQAMHREVFVTANELRDIAALTRSVTAAQFPGVEGKALGQAISDARRQAVADALDAK